MGVYEIVAIILSLLVLLGIKLMSSPKTAVYGNQISALSMLSAIILVLVYNEIISMPLLWVAILIGGIIGYIIAKKVNMIQMPQMVALLNGLGGGTSAIVALVEIFERYENMIYFERITSQLALIVGGITLSGSLIAAAKLDRKIPQKPVVLKGHSILLNISLIVLCVLAIFGTLNNYSMIDIISISALFISILFGILFSIRVGGADMPITISLLNSCSGLAGAICGFTIGDPLLVSVGAIVGASGIILTQIMCKAMNRSLMDVLKGSHIADKTFTGEIIAVSVERDTQEEKKSVHDILQEAKKVIIVPGYGMALAQAQYLVKQLTDKLESEGKDVKFAIHPVAGRMPGHMNVLLAEVDIPYEKLWDMDNINPEFEETDLTIVIGACDVVNPAASYAEGTPIYGMPVLDVDKSKYVIVCNMDTKPGYSGVENPLYNMNNVTMLLGNAAETLKKLAE
jgi:NAD(P) transhydrogenase subunit beta